MSGVRGGVGCVGEVEQARAGDRVGGAAFFPCFPLSPWNWHTPAPGFTRFTK